MNSLTISHSIQTLGLFMTVKFKYSRHEKYSTRHYC